MVTPFFLSELIEQQIGIGGIGPVGFICHGLQGIGFCTKGIHTGNNGIVVVHGCSLCIFRYRLQRMAQDINGVIQSIGMNGQVADKYTFRTARYTHILLHRQGITQILGIADGSRQDLMNSHIQHGFSFDGHDLIISFQMDGISGPELRFCKNTVTDHQINILDISQTITQGFFNMMMIVDTSKMTVDYSTMTEEITKIGESTGVQIKCQKEEIFDKMHRI